MHGDTVVFAAGSRPPCDSALELALQVAERAPNLRLVWLGPRSRSHFLDLPPFIYARPLSIGHVAELARARLIITTHGARRLGFKAPPILQTFHGIPIKRLGRRNLRYDALTKEAGQSVRARRWDFIVSPSESYEMEVVEAQSWRGVRIRVPLPRYSLTQRVRREDSRLRLRHKLGLDPSTKIVLFAPTYRAAHDLGSFDPMSTHQLLARLLGDEYFVLDRCHHAHPTEKSEETLNKELRAEDSLLVLSACDFLVIDYSSLMVDAAFLDTPTVLLVPDIDVYERSPGFTIPLRRSASTMLTSCVASAAEQIAEGIGKGFAPGFRQELLSIAGLPHDPLSVLPSPFERDSDLAAILG